MHISTIKRIAVMHMVNHWFVGTRCFEVKNGLLRSIGYEIGEGTKIVGPITNTGKLIIGKNCWIGTNITVHGNGCVRIGDNCDIAPDVAFLTGGHEIGGAERRAGSGLTYSITVGSGTWIGARATIFSNTNIGSGCVIAACACVNKSVVDNTLVGGTPARKIRDV